MELLIVITIIMILMGMIFAGIRLAREAAKRAKTQATMDQLRAALESYRQTQGKYPEGGTFDGLFTGNPKFNESPFNPLPDNKPSAKWDDVSKALIESLKEVGVNDFKSPVVDGWKMSFHYRPALYLPFDDSATETIDKADPPGRDSYQLWSVGRDEMDQGGNVLGDDITSWVKK